MYGGHKVNRPWMILLYTDSTQTENLMSGNRERKRLA